MMRTILCAVLSFGVLVSGNVLFDKIKKKGWPGTWPTFWPKNTKSWNCKTSAGMDQLGTYPAAEDAEFSPTYNITVVSVGFRHYLLPSYNTPVPFSGVLAYPLDQSTPVKIAVPAPFNPQGLSLFDKGNGVLRIFVVSHVTSSGAGKEEIVVIDYNTKTKTADSIRRVDTGDKSVTDIAAISATKFVLTLDVTDRTSAEFDKAIAIKTDTSVKRYAAIRTIKETSSGIVVEFHNVLRLHQFFRLPSSVVYHKSYLYVADPFYGAIQIFKHNSGDDFSQVAAQVVRPLIINKLSIAEDGSLIALGNSRLVDPVRKFVPCDSTLAATNANCTSSNSNGTWITTGSANVNITVLRLEAAAGSGFLSVKELIMHTESKTPASVFVSMRNGAAAFVGSTEQALLSCTAHTCSCPNGVVKTGSACTKGGGVQCASCSSGYHLKNNACVANQCTCPGHGTVATGAQCISNGIFMCVSCDAGYRKANNICKKNTCTCTNGAVVAQANCTTDNIVLCATCSNLHHLVTNGNSKSCQPNQCSCVNGQCATPLTKNQDTTCVICNTGYQLQGTVCVKVTCQSNQALVGGTCQAFSKTTDVTGSLTTNVQWSAALTNTQSAEFKALQSKLSTILKRALPQALSVLLQSVSKSSTGRRKRATTEAVAAKYRIKLKLTSNQQAVTYVNSQLKTNENYLKSHVTMPPLTKSSVVANSATTLDNPKAGRAQETKCQDIRDSKGNIVGNTCDVTTESVAAVANDMTAVVSAIESGQQATKSQIASVVSGMAQITIASNTDSLNQTAIEALQASFEKILINTEPNVDYTSANGLIQVQTKKTASTLGSPKQVMYNGKPVSITKAYTFDSSDLKVVIPDSVVTNTGCKTPAAFAKMKHATHVAPKTDSGLKAGTDTMVIKTCNPSSASLSAPVVVSYGNVKPPGDLDGEETKLEPVCAFYDPSTSTWKMDNVNTINNGNSVDCVVGHLSYFSLLFRPRTTQAPADKTLSIADKVFTIAATAALMIVITVTLLNTGYSKLLKRPRIRSVIFLAISLLMINIVFIFGQQFFWPTNRYSCAAVAALQMFLTIGLFLTTFWEAVSLLMQAMGRQRELYGSVHFWSQLSLPYVVAGVITGATVLCTRYGYSNGLSMYLGTAKTSLDFLRVQITDPQSGQQLCYVTGLALYVGVMVPYVVAMLTVIMVYIFCIHKIRSTVEADVSKIQKLKQDLKAMTFVFFTLGIGWLSLLLVISGDTGIWADWVFTIFRFLQPVALLLATTDEVATNFIKTRRLFGRFSTWLGQQSKCCSSGSKDDYDL